MREFLRRVSVANISLERSWHVGEEWIAQAVRVDIF